MHSFAPPTPPHRAFVFAYHPSHGLLLLLSTKPSRPYQVPGGRVDSSDYPASSALGAAAYLAAGAE
eukprot:CAMPEP_0182472192 /NCGR_PEP_ID=MMETSP1319-20130603/21701_1 /TAXON_ID=172717 /ORGANISM="Bolidomonas pacifica, Strain RCC208" /LENGTH=65 /DNA_ID=CAMNT_0024672839 /DNA_START=157 /DNA_END=351 /DNA_ORIENTATION=-